jgi:hypothetical protein
VRALIEQLDAFAGGSDRIVMSQLHGLSEEQRGELSLKVSLSDSAARRLAELGKSPGQKPVKEVVAGATIEAKARQPRAEPASGGASKSAMLGVAVLSAALAGGSAYYFARGRGASAPAAPSAATSSIEARVQVVPADARVVTRDGMIPVVAGVATLHGQAGETLNVTVQQGAISKTFSVSLGSDGIATPGRLALE